MYMICMYYSIVHTYHIHRSDMYVYIYARWVGFQMSRRGSRIYSSESEAPETFSRRRAAMLWTRKHLESELRHRELEGLEAPRRGVHKCFTSDHQRVSLLRVTRPSCNQSVMIIVITGEISLASVECCLRRIRTWQGSSIS